MIYIAATLTLLYIAATCLSGYYVAKGEAPVLTFWFWLLLANVWTIVTGVLALTIAA